MADLAELTITVHTNADDATDELTHLSRASAKAGAAAKAQARATDKLGSELSSAQRQASNMSATTRRLVQVLSRAANLFGVMAAAIAGATAAAVMFHDQLLAIGAIAGGILVNVTFEQFRERMRSAADSTRELRTQMQALYDVANQAGVLAGSIGQGFSKLVAASDAAGNSLKQTISIARGFTVAAGAMGMASSDINDVLANLVPLVQKSKVTISDLASALEFTNDPAYVLSAALGDVVTVSGKLNEDLIVSGQSLLAVANYLQRTAEQSTGLNEVWNRLINTFTQLLQRFNQAGVMNAIINQLQRLQKWAQSPEAAQKIQHLADIAVRMINAVGDAIAWLFNHLEKIERIIETLFVYFVSRAIFRIAADAVAAFATAARGASAAVGVLRGTLALLGGPAGILALVVTGIYAWISAADDLGAKIDKQRSKVHHLVEEWEDLTRAQRQSALFEQQETVRLLNQQLDNQLSHFRDVKKDLRAIYENRGMPIPDDFVDKSNGLLWSEKEYIRTKARLQETLSKLDKAKQLAHQIKTGNVLQFNDSGETNPSYSSTVETSVSRGDTGISGAERSSIQSIRKSQQAFQQWQQWQQQLAQSRRSVLMQFGSEEVQKQLAFDKAEERIHKYINDWQLAQRLISRAHEQIERRFKGTTSAMSQFAIEAARNIQDALGQTLSRVLGGHFDNIGQMWLNMIRQMAAQATAANLSEALFGNYGSTGKIGGVVGDFLGIGSKGWGTLGNWFSSFAGLFANGGTIGPGQWGIAGEAGVPEIVSGPATVTPVAQIPTVSGSSQTLVFNYYEQEGKTEEQRKRDQRSFAQTVQSAVQDVMVRDVSERGPISRSYEMTYNLGRSGVM